jgi:hypothetical protein
MKYETLLPAFVKLSVDGELWNGSNSRFIAVSVLLFLSKHKNQKYDGTQHEYLDKMWNFAG